MYDLVDIGRQGGLTQGMIVGGGIGPFTYYKKACEVSAHIVFSTRGLITNRSLVGFYPTSVRN